MCIIEKLTDKIRGYKTRNLNLIEFIEQNKLDMILNNNLNMEEFELYNWDEQWALEVENIETYLIDYKDDILELFDGVDAYEVGVLLDAGEYEEVLENEAVRELISEMAIEGIESEAIYQYFIISEYDAERYWAKYTNYPIYYKPEEELYVLGITHWGMSWKFFNTNYQIKEYL